MGVYQKDMNFESIKRMTSSYNTNTTKATGNKVLSHYSCCRLFLRHEFSSSVGECKRILGITLIRERQFFLPYHKKRINSASYRFFSFSFLYSILYYKTNPFHNEEESVPGFSFCILTKQKNLPMEKWRILENKQISV